MTTLCAARYKGRNLNLEATCCRAAMALPSESSLNKRQVQPALACYRDVSRITPAEPAAPVLKAPQQFDMAQKRQHRKRKPERQQGSSQASLQTAYKSHIKLIAKNRVIAVHNSRTAENACATNNGKSAYPQAASVMKRNTTVTMINVEIQQKRRH